MRIPRVYYISDRLGQVRLSPNYNTFGNIFGIHLGNARPVRAAPVLKGACGLVDKTLDYSSKGPGFNSR